MASLFRLSDVAVLLFLLLLLLLLLCLLLPMLPASGASGALSPTGGVDSSEVNVKVVGFGSAAIFFTFAFFLGRGLGGAMRRGSK